MNGLDSFDQLALFVGYMTILIVVGTAIDYFLKSFKRDDRKD